jgi:hypothetical protein
MVRAIHRHCGLGQSVPVTGRLSDSLVRSPFRYWDSFLCRCGDVLLRRREGGHEGLLDYLETKYIATQW